MDTHLCQSTSFIRKYIFDLAKVVCEVPTSCEGRLVELLVPYFRVKVDECSLAGAHELDGDVKRDGDDILKRDECKRPCDEPVDGGVVVGEVVTVQPEGAAGVIPVFEHGVDDTAYTSHEPKDD
jgi:hypothetical protein